MGLRFAAGDGGVVRWRIAGAQCGDAFSREDPSVEAFALTVSEKEIVLEAGHERGLLHGTHYLERLMADRGGPWLKRGRLERVPAFSPRISNGAFIEADQKITALGRFSDEYLALMSHFGVNGIHLYVNLWDLCRNSVLPELNTREFDAHIAALNSFNERTLRFGIDLYLHLNTRLFKPDHLVFHSHPEARGAKAEIFLEQFEGLEEYNLCSSHNLVLDCYAETLTNLFTAAPRLAGAVIIVGGECFYHCFTRPEPSAEGMTNCPRCQRKDPSEQVANLTNRLAAAIKGTGAHKSVFAWPYSAFVWSGADRAQIGWINRLSEDVSVLSTFDTGVADKVNAAGVVLFDYNIKQIGPSEIFTAQARALAAKQRPIFCKTETNTTPEAFFLPYLPVHQRWHGRFTAMRNAGVAGFIGQWRFYGMNGSPPEELQYHATWNPDVPAEELLARMAQRDFEVSADTAHEVVSAWGTLSDAWDSFPYSAMMCGEREAYMRGPFYLGPAHPLILNVQDNYRLGAKFRQLRGDLLEMADPEKLDEYLRNAKPRYVSDLLLTVPFGVERCLELLDRCRRTWSRGLQELKSLLMLSQSPRAQMELDVCETIDIHLATTEHVIRFYAARDRLWQQHLTLPEFRDRLAELSAVAQAEIENSRRILPILARDFRIGYGHCYGVVYDDEMVRDKLRQCEYVLNQEIPRLGAVIRFHLWHDFP